MAFVHSLVKAEIRGRIGWCAPVELGEAAPHYISFVVPVDEDGRFLTTYSCETITAYNGEKRIESNTLVRQGDDTFILRLGKMELWFTVCPVRQGASSRLPYVGKLEHPDFTTLFTEIEPEEPDTLDSFYEEQDTFIIGCEPFSHYGGIEKIKKVK